MSDPWIDVAAHPSGGFVTATGGAGVVRVEHDGLLIWEHHVPTDWLRFIDLAVSPQGQIAVGGQGGEGEAWLLEDDKPARSLGPTYGMFPVAVRWEGETLHTYRCGPGDFVPLYVDGVEVMRTHQVEGIRDVLPDGTIVLGQPTAEGHFDGHNFGQFTRRDGWIVGQSGFTIGCLHEASHQYFTAHTGTMAEGIHFAVQGETIAVCALTNTGAFFQTFSPPYPSDGTPVPLPDLPKVPMPTRPARFWFGPNIASADEVRCFDDPSVLSDVGVFVFPTQQILDNGGSVTGPNTWANLKANHVFKKLQAAGIATAIEGGSLSDLECVTKIRAEGGEVHYFSITEPLVAKTPLASLVDVVKATRALGVKAGWIEAFPAGLMPQQKALLAQLIAAGATPDYWHLDIDRARAKREGKDVPGYVTEAKAVAAAAGIPLGVILWGDDGHRTDAEYAADSLTFATQVKAMPAVDHLCVQSWAVRKGGIQDIPLNLGPNGLLALLRQVRQIFGATTVPPVDTVPIPQPTGAVMFSKYIDTYGVLLVKSVGKTVILPDDAVFSCQGDGVPGTRPAGTDGEWELVRAASASTVTLRNDGKHFTFPYVVVSA